MVECSGDAGFVRFVVSRIFVDGDMRATVQRFGICAGEILGEQIDQKQMRFGTTGNDAQAALDQALAVITRGGRISLLGIFGEPVRIDLSDLVIQKGVRIYGIYGRRIYDSWERTQALLRSGALDVTPIITHRFDLADWERGFELIASRHAGKVVLLP